MTLGQQEESSAMTARAPRSKRDPLVQPFLKWAGGKRQLLPSLRPFVPEEVGQYFEPFLGAGAMLFDVQPPRAVVNDANGELVNCYQIIRDAPEELLEAVSAHENTRAFFYRIREMDRSPKFALLTPTERAARLLFLNKTCFNGLFRVNSQGQFNVPFGDYKNPVFADPAVIRAVSRYLNAAQIAFRNEDFAQVVQDAAPGDFVYFDPPYDPISETASFTGYSLSGFDRDAQRRLKDVCDALTQRGVKLLLSNSDTPFIRALYSESFYRLHAVQARRNINAVPSGRGKIGELLIVNFDS